MVWSHVLQIAFQSFCCAERGSRSVRKAVKFYRLHGITGNMLLVLSFRKSLDYLHMFVVIRDVTRRKSSSV